MATYRASAATTARRIGRSCRQSKLHSLKEEIKVERPFCFFFVFNYYLLIPPLLQTSDFCVGIIQLAHEILLPQPKDFSAESVVEKMKNAL